jgi:hypothetical protein
MTLTKYEDIAKYLRPVSRRGADESHAEVEARRRAYV